MKLQPKHKYRQWSAELNKENDMSEHIRHALCSTGIANPTVTSGVNISRTIPEIVTGLNAIDEELREMEERWETKSVHDLYVDLFSDPQTIIDISLNFDGSSTSWHIYDSSKTSIKAIAARSTWIAALESKESMEKIVTRTASSNAKLEAYTPVNIHTATGCSCCALALIWDGIVARKRAKLTEFNDY